MSDDKTERADVDEARELLAEIVSRLYLENDRGIGWRLGEPGEGEDNATLIERARAFLYPRQL